MEKSKKSELFGVPFVLIIHAFILTLLLSIATAIVVSRMVTQPLLKIDQRLHDLEIRPTISVTPTASPSATPTPTTSRIQRFPTVVPTVK